jgi:hypothetical protein
MATVITSVADVVNLALRNIGYKLRIGHIYDGSDAANQALDIYGQTRDDALRDGEWHFAERTASLSNPLKSAPDNYFDAPWDSAANPPPPWRFEYAYPADCLKARQVKFASGFIFNPAPTPVLWEDANDQYFAPARRVILCNLNPALLVYTGQITDMATWPPDFVDLLAARLGARLKRGLMSADLTAVDASEVTEAQQTAQSEQG